MLAALGLERLAPDLATFGRLAVRFGTPWRFAVSRMARRESLLAEGKNYPREMDNGGTAAGRAGSAKSLASRRQIELAVAHTQGRLGVALNPSRWLDPLDPTRPSSSLYQTANRLAYTVWFRDRGVDAWLCHLLYLDDPLYRPTSRAVWEAGLEQADRELGIDGLRLDFTGHAFLPALDPTHELDRNDGAASA